MKSRKKLGVVAVMAVIAALMPVLPATGQTLPEADIIFAVDESGSMGGEQAALQANIKAVANDLAAAADGRYGLVGYGARNPDPVTEQPLTDDLTAFETAVDGLTIDGSIEPGYDATIHALTDPNMGLRATAGTCVVLATDEPSNGDTATAQQAIDALALEGAFFFGLVEDDGSTPGSYQPLADASGGALFDLDAFTSDPANVLAALLNSCIQAVASSGGSVDVHPTSCPNPFALGKRGVVPAAILGTEVLDVNDIDPTTVELSGPGGTATPLRWSIEDVAAPDEFPQPETRDDCGTDGPDGFDDLTLKFAADEFQAALGDVQIGDVVIVTISAETFDGGDVSGTDIVWVNAEVGGPSGTTPAPPASGPPSEAPPSSTPPSPGPPPGSAGSNGGGPQIPDEAADSVPEFLRP